MKRLLILSKVNIKPSFIVLSVLIILSGYYKLFFIYYLITLIHELFHLFALIVFNVKVNSLNVSAIGFSIDSSDLKSLSFIKQFIIYIIGPLSYFFSSYLLELLFINGSFSYLMYLRFNDINRYIFIFNMLPIYPLDGGRIFELFTSHLFTYKVSKKLVIFISFIFTILFCIYTSYYKQYMIYIFLIISLFLNVINFNREYLDFLFKRLILKNKYKDKIHYKNDLYTYKNNYVIKDKKIINEKELILEILND